MFIQFECDEVNCEQKISLYIPNEDDILIIHECLCGFNYLIGLSVLKEKGGKKDG